MKYIPLTKGKIAIIDDSDYDIVNQYTWHFDGRYARAYVRGSYKKDKVTNKSSQKMIRMHQLLMPCDSDHFVDHINGDKLDNRRSNLRRVDVYQSSWNTRKTKKNMSSPFKGVSWHKQRKKWKVEISFDDKRSFIGLYKDEEEAAKAYDSAARYYFGEYAVTNFSGDEKLSVEELRLQNPSTRDYKDGIPKNRFRKVKKRKNRKKRSKKNSSNYIGVTYNNLNNKWMSVIDINRTKKCLGFFNNEDEAAKAYDKEILKLQGKKARTNFNYE